MRLALPQRINRETSFGKLEIVSLEIDASKAVYLDVEKGVHVLFSQNRPHIVSAHRDRPKLF